MFAVFVLVFKNDVCLRPKGKKMLTKMHAQTHSYADRISFGRAKMPFAWRRESGTGRLCECVDETETNSEQIKMKMCVLKVCFVYSFEFSMRYVRTFFSVVSLPFVCLYLLSFYRQLSNTSRMKSFRFEFFESAYVCVCVCVSRMRVMFL